MALAGGTVKPTQIAIPTREKETFYLTEYIVPRWGNLRLNQIQPKAVEDWLHTTFDSWWTMHGVRAIMSRIYHYAEGHGLWEEGKRTPVSRAKLGKKRHKYERRILTFDETARVLARLEEPNRLIVETCIATGARISEVLGLEWRHLNLEAGTIKIEQRVWHQDVGRPKSEDSKRTLGIGDLIDRFRVKAAEDGATRRHLSSSRSGRLGDRCGIRGFVTHSTKQPKLRAATFLASGRIPSVEPTSLGDSRSVVARSRRLRSQATATWK